MNLLDVYSVYNRNCVVYCGVIGVVFVCVQCAWCRLTFLGHSIASLSFTSATPLLSIRVRMPGPLALCVIKLKYLYIKCMNYTSDMLLFCVFVVVGLTRKMQYL